jgi:hypothetical protein
MEQVRWSNNAQHHIKLRRRAEKDAKSHISHFAHFNTFSITPTAPPKQMCVEVTFNETQLQKRGIEADSTCACDTAQKKKKNSSRKKGGDRKESTITSSSTAHTHTHTERGGGGVKIEEKRRRVQKRKWVNTVPP